MRADQRWVMARELKSNRDGGAIAGKVGWAEAPPLMMLVCFGAIAGVSYEVVGWKWV